MKKILIVLGILIGLLIAALFIVPVVFKDDIVKFIEKEANNAVHAKVEFGDVDISLISSFPDFSLDLYDLVVTGNDSFAGLDLANIRHLNLVLDLKSVLDNDPVVEFFGLYDSKVNLKILKDGTANYDIAKTDSTVVEVESVEEEDTEPMNIGLEAFEIKGLDFVYDDAMYATLMKLEGLNLSGSGSTNIDVYDLSLDTKLDAFTFAYDGIAYMDSAQVDYMADVKVDLNAFRFDLGDNNLAINGIHLNLDGWFAMPSEDIDMDLKFEAKETDFKSLLTLIPSIYQQDFASIETSGKFDFGGFAKGALTATEYPAFDIHLGVTDGQFHYPDLPAGVEDIQVKMKLSNPGGIDDLTVIDINQFHLNMAGNPVDIGLLVKQPVSDPYIKSMIRTNLNLGSIEQVLPLAEGENYEGIVTADLNMEGRVSALEKEKYDQFKASGTLSLLDINYRSPDLPYAVAIENLQSEFSPEKVTLENCELQLGKSDVRLVGTIDNLLSYYFGRQPLHGRFNMTSNLLDVNELMDIPVDSTETDESEEEAVSDSACEDIIEIPADIDFELMSNLNKVLYDNLVMEQIKGTIRIKDQKASFDKVKVNTLGGSMVLDGSFSTPTGGQPAFDFDFNMQHIQIPQAFAAFNTVQKLAPIAEKAEGGVSTQLHLSSLLTSSLDPVYNSMTGGGKLLTENVVMENADGLKKLAGVLNMKQFNQIQLNNVSIQYRFNNGRIEVDPFDVKLGDSKATIGGSNGFDQTMDYNIAMVIPQSEMGTGAALASSLMSQLDGSSSDEMNVNVLVGGTVKEPKFTPQFGKSGAKAAAKEKATEIVDQAKERAQAEADALKKEAEAKLKAEEERLRQEAEAKKKEAEEKAKAEAERVKKEAEEKAKAESEKVKEQAKDKVKGLFK